MLFFKQKYFLSLILQFISIAVFAQLNISPNGSASALVNTIVGPGVTVTNASLNCNSQASGTFNSSGTNLGISSGIILSTGTAVHAAGANNDDGGGDQTGCFNPSGSNFFDG